MEKRSVRGVEGAAVVLEVLPLLLLLLLLPDAEVAEVAERTGVGVARLRSDIRYHANKQRDRESETVCER